MYDYAIVGGGIVGLATALKLTETFPQAKVLVLEKENGWARHQTGNNSGVIHSGIYYKPGSYKARFAREGNRSMVAFCQQHGIAHEVCGKIIVATQPHELPQLEKLYQRGLDNQLDVRKIDATEICAYGAARQSISRAICCQHRDCKLQPSGRNVCPAAQGARRNTDAWRTGRSVTPAGRRYHH